MSTEEPGSRKEQALTQFWVSCAKKNPKLQQLNQDHAAMEHFRGRVKANKGLRQ